MNRWDHSKIPCGYYESYLQMFLLVCFCLFGGFFALQLKATRRSCEPSSQNLQEDLQDGKFKTLTLPVGGSPAAGRHVPRHGCQHPPKGIPVGDPTQVAALARGPGGEAEGAPGETWRPPHQGKAQPGPQIPAPSSRRPRAAPSQSLPAAGVCPLRPKSPVGITQRGAGWRGGCPAPRLAPRAVLGCSEACVRGRRLPRRQRAEALPRGGGGASAVPYKSPADPARPQARPLPPASPWAAAGRAGSGASVPSAGNRGGREMAAPEVAALPRDAGWGRAACAGQGGGVCV